MKHKRNIAREAFCAGVAAGITTQRERSAKIAEALGSTLGTDYDSSHNLSLLIAKAIRNDEKSDAANAIRFLESDANNLASGTIRCYGVAK